MPAEDTLKQSALDWLDRKKKQADEVADRLRSTARVNAPMLEQQAATMSPTLVAPVLGAGALMKQGLTPTAPTAEDKQQVTPPPPPPPATTATAQPQTFAMPTMAGGGGGTSRSSTSITEGAKISPETRAMLDQSGQEQRSAIQQSSEAEQGANALEANQAARVANKQEQLRIAAELDPKTLHISHQVDEETQKLKDMQGEKIDAKHFQDSQTLGQRLAWALAMGLGGFAAGLKGGTNTAAQLYSQAIQDDIDAQRANLSHKTEIQKGLLGDLQKRFADKQQQDAAAQITGLNIYKQKLAAEGADSKNAIVKANHARELAAADNLIAQQKAKFDEATSNRVTRNYETVSGGAGAAGGMTPEKLAEARQHIIDQIVASGKTPTPQMVDGYLALRYGLNPGQVANISKQGAAGGIDTSGLRKIGEAATGIGAKDVALSFLPSFLAPESNNAAQRMADYSSTVRGTLKSIEPRLADDELNRQASAYEISPAMPPAVQKQRVESFIARVQASNAAKKASNIDVGDQ